MARRKVQLVNGEYYHVFTKSIAEFHVFKHPSDFERVLQLLKFFRLKDNPCRFVWFMELKEPQELGFDAAFAKFAEGKETLVDVYAYCVMSTHLHLILKQKVDGGISKYMGDVLNSYARYFNTRHLRQGPLWAGRFKSVRVEDDDQMLHLTRYIHLNPATAGLVKSPEHWQYSSYAAYTDPAIKDSLIAKDLKHVMDFQPDSYRQFVEDRIDYQRTLAKIKSALCE